MNRKKETSVINAYIVNLQTHRGDWFLFPASLDKIRNSLQLEEDQDYEITDYEAPFNLHGYERLEALNEIAERLEENEKHPAFHYIGELVENGFFETTEDALDKIDEIIVYEGCQSYAAFAEAYVDECGYLQMVPELIACHIDYDGIGHDFSFEGNLYQADDSTIIEVCY